MRKRVTKQDLKGLAKDKRRRAAKDSAKPAVIETLESRLLLSGSVSDAIINQNDFAEYLDSVGLNGLDQLDIQVTLDVPDGFVTASGAERLAASTGAGLVDVGTQPQGALSGKIVYVHGGHGITSDNQGNGSWSYQRPQLLDLVEDLSNQDMMTFLVDFLWNAGATVVPLRPVGNQLNEVVLDNDDVEVTFSGAWSNSSSSVYYGDPGDTPYRFASTSAAETAFARYRPNITEAGVYPVYTWTRAGSDRTNQLYRVTHSGGTTEVTVNHRRVGNGLVYLGSYYFEQGTGGYVDISNRNSEAGKVVIADMIRFGNGMGDIDRGGGVSGQSRENEAALYWIEAQAGQGIPSSAWRSSSNDRTATVGASPRWAAQMNRSADGVLSDRVFVSYHSNAGGGTSRGVLALYNGNNDPTTATPNQFELANLLGREINDDMVALDGTFEWNWQNRSVVTLDRSDIEFGEINNHSINNEFDATIVEWAFHDNAMDTDLMRDARVRSAVARASYQGLVRYFNQFDGGVTPVSFLPDPVTDLKATSNGDGTVTLDWNAAVLNGIGGDAPTGYKVYASLNGRGFDGGTLVAGVGTTSYTALGLDPTNGTYYFKVVAVNGGGESQDSPVVAATPLAVPSSVLIVNGFDRIDKGTNVIAPFPFGGTVDRIRPLFQNSQDYAVQVGEAIEAFNPALGIDTVQNENIINGDVLLSDYDTVVWILGEESSADDTFNSAEQTLVSAFITSGGDLFVSGAEIGWDLDNLNNGQTFYNGTLRADYVADDANTYNVTGAAGSIFAGLSFSFDDGTLFYDSEFPDVINPLGGAVTALNYVGGSGGGAAIQYKGSTDGDVVMLAFPFETITTEADRAAVMTAVMNFFGAPPSEIPSAPNGVVATAGDDTVAVDWNDNTEPDLLGYDIQRATSSGGPYTTLNVTPLLVSQFTDNTAANGTTYFYQVVAIDTDTNVSAPSVEVSALPDDHGNDKDSATLVAVPSTTDGQMGTGDTDWFELNLDSSTDYTFSVLDAGLGNAEIRLYTSGLTLLTSDAGPAAGGTLAEVQFSAVVGDIYYLEVVGGSGAVGDYLLAIQETDDHGNTIGEATDLLGPFAPGTIEIGGDIDFFRVPAIAGMTYTFKVQDLSIPDAILTLYDAGGGVITTDTGSSPGGTHAQIVWAAPASGFIFLSVEAQPTSIGDYALTVASTTAITGDLDGDGFVGISDLNIVLGNWNLNVPPGDPLADPSGDGFVGINDLNIVLGNWNAGAPPAAEASSSEPEVVAAATVQPTEAKLAEARLADTKVAAGTSSGTQKNSRKQGRQAGEVQADRTNGLAIANWRASQRSAFADADGEHYTPAMGLWESGDDA
jgi:fibronectin type III domain protein